jgi:hypothetical protein
MQMTSLPLSLAQIKLDVESATAALAASNQVKPM